MNVRITRHDAPHRQDLYSGVRRVYSNDRLLFLGITHTTSQSVAVIKLLRREIAEVALDEDGGIE